MNTPSKPDGNWRWRMWKEAPSEGLADHLAYLAQLYGRARPLRNEEPQEAEESAAE